MLYTREYIQEITTIPTSFDGRVTAVDGNWWIDRNGKRYLDCSGNIGSQNMFGARMTPSGHLMHSQAYDDFVITLVETFRFPHAVPVSSGDKANLFAMKLAFERTQCSQNAPILVFENAFHGRSPEMEALSGGFINPLVAFDRIVRLPFYSRQNPHEAFNLLVSFFQNKDFRPFCFLAELFQGEGGFNYAPPSFFIPLFSLCKQRSMPIIVDEVQTCCRMGFPLLTHRYNLEAFVDMVTIGKTTQTSALLFKDGFNAYRAHVSETNPGGWEDQLQSGTQQLRKLLEGEYWGPKGKIMQLEKMLHRRFRKLQEQNRALIYTALGATAAFRLSTFHEERAAKECASRLVDYGVSATTCGRGNSHKVRLYIPLTIQEEELNFLFYGIQKVTNEHKEGK